MASEMSMGSKEIRRVEEIVETYGDEVMYAGWNPQLVSACKHRIVQDRRNRIPPPLADADIEVFLQKMYVCQR